MAADFDPYYKWLGIHPKDQPPHHYRLLGVELFESDPEVIEAAADRHIAYASSALPEQAAPVTGTFRGTGAAAAMSHKVEMSVEK